MPTNSNPSSWPVKFFRGSALILGGVICLQISLELLLAIWPWLLLIAVIVAGVLSVIWWLRQRQNW
ncbi:hypothetical protein [Corynebacterium glutamicum]|uniref:hypothetical protein n=1 Tax=Corynebacterium glutamicum TaxID=1718 RepID=UPI00094221ED|nr:hypothetical protein [Corynebacterium glutamicum]OKX84259.1 hypothetical protein AUO95_03485 [Corynebacterium glutamicum]